MQLAERFAERRNIAQVSAWQYDPLRRVPVPLIQHLDNNRLLALDAKRVDRIQQIDPEAFGEHPDKLQNLIEVGFDLQRESAILQRLGQLPVRNVSVRNKDD